MRLRAGRSGVRGGGTFEVLSVGLFALGLLGGAARAAEVSADDRALATVLFQEGRALMTQGRIPEACQKLEESERLDPAGGTLLNLALCHEQEGRLARSWSEFNEAVTLARRDGRPDREVAGKDHARALEGRISRLTIVVAPGAEVEGLRIERDGREIGRGAWATPIPVDGGEHFIRATAPGKEPFTTKVVVGKEADAKTVEIPGLATAAVVAAAVDLSRSSSPAPAPVPAPALTPARRKQLRWAGIAAAGLGVAVLGAAGYELSTALGYKSDSKADCTGDLCGPVGLKNRSDAASHGNLATILGLSGAVLAGAGASLFLYGRSSGRSETEASVRTGFLFEVTPGTVLTGIEGGF